MIPDERRTTGRTAPLGSEVDSSALERATTPFERRALSVAVFACLLAFGMLVGQSMPAADSNPLQATGEPTVLPTVVRTSPATFPPPASVTPPASPTPLPATPTIPVVTATSPPTLTPSLTPIASHTPVVSATPTSVGVTPGTPKPSDTPRGTDTPSVTPTPSWSPTPSDTPTITPPPSPTPCQDTWMIYVHAFIDTVGVGGYACPGCDKEHTDGDDWGQPIFCKLEPLHMVVHEPGNPRNIYQQAVVSRFRSDLDITHNFYLCVPPPYELTLVTTNPLCYVPCPNSDISLTIDQRDFDRVRNSHKGKGRYYKHEWNFWKCDALNTPTPPPDETCAIHPDGERMCAPTGGTYSGYHGGFESAILPFGTPLDWKRLRNGLHTGAPDPAINAASLQIHEPRAGFTNPGGIEHDFAVLANGPKSSDLKVMLHRRDNGGGSFSLRARIDGGAEVLIADQNTNGGPRGQWYAPPAVPISGLAAGPHTLEFLWEVEQGVELFLDDVDLDFCCEGEQDTPTPVTPSSTPTASPTNTPSNTPTPTPTDTPSPTPTPTNTPSNTPTVPTPTPSNTPTVPTPTPITPSPTPSPTATVPTATPSNTPTVPTPTPITPSPTPSPTATVPTATPSNTPTVPTPTPITPSPTPSPTATVPTATPSNTPTVPTPTPVTPSATPTPSNTPVTPSATPTASNTPVTPSATPTATNTPVTPSATPSNTPSASPTSPDWTPTPTHTPQPRQTEVPGEGCRPKVRIHKFEDLDRDGVLDEGEPMLEGVQFDIVQLPREPDQAEQVHQRTTDAQGLAEIVFYGPTRVRIRELLRESGGQWGITTPHDRVGRHWYILPERARIADTADLVEPQSATLPVDDLRIQLSSEYRHGGDCDDVDIWVGNARNFLPKTGAGGNGGRSTQRVSLELSFD